MKVVLDSSAILAFLRNERGGDAVLAHGRGAIVSAVNFSETLAKAGDKGVDAALVSHMIERMEIVVIPFDSAHAVAAAALRPSTRHKGVSFADRACIALGKLRELPVLTGDTKWSSLDLDLDIDIRQIR